MKEENLYDHPWLVMTSDLRDRKVARGETVHDIKSVNPRFQEQGSMNNPKGRVSPGEDLMKMLRILPVRPPGGRQPLGVGGATEWEQGGRKPRLALGCVGRGWLELVDDLIFRGVRLGLLHLRQQLQRLLLLFCRVVAQEVGCCGQD